MTKDEASDLNSYIMRVRQCDREFQIAEWQKKDAEGKLASFIWQLENKKEVLSKPQVKESA